MAHEDEGQRVWNVQRQADGWPEGVNEGHRATITSAVRRVLEANPQGLPLHQIVDIVRMDSTVYRGFVLWSTIYAATERALRSLDDAEEVWKLKGGKR